MDDKTKTWAPVGLAVTAAIGLAVATWLEPASVLLVNWTALGGRRVALLPSLSGLVAGMAFAALAVGVVWLLAGRSPERRRGRARPALSALLLFWLWPVPYLPVLADQFPTLLVLAGGARWLVAALAVAGVCWALWGERVARLVTLRDLRPVWLFAVALAIYVGAGTYVHRAQGFGGDEPHYLVITHSLLADGDLRIENNHQQEDYRAFFPGSLAPHFLRRGVNGVIYSVHAPGLPAIALPAYALAGAEGVRVFISVIASLAGVALFLLARALAGSGPGLVAWLAVMFGTPLLFHGWLVFPETPAGALTAWGAWWLWADLPRRSWTWAWRGALLVLLPWLHAKFAVLLACLGVALACRLVARRAWASAAWLAAPAVAGLALWLYAFFVMYGVANPAIVYGDLSAMTYELQWSNVPRGMLGYAFDQEYGLWLHAPVYLLAVPGAWYLLRERQQRWLGVFVAVAVAVFLISTTRYYMWWGGWSVPSRFLVPVLPLCGLAIAVCVAHARSARARGVVGLLVGATLAVSVALTVRPDRFLMFNDRDGRGNLVEWLQGHVRLDQVLPTLLWVDWEAQLPAVVLLVAALAVAYLASRGGRRRDDDHMTAYWAAVGFLLSFGVTVALGAGLVSSSASMRGSVRDGRLAWLDATGDGRMAVDLAALRRARWQDDWPGPVSFEAPADPSEDARTAIGPIALPPGRYEAAAWFRPNRAAEGELRLTFHPGNAALATVATRGLTPVRFAFEIPPEVVAPPLWLGAGTLPVAQGLSRLDITPLSIVDSSGRGGSPAVAIDSIPGSDGAFLAYLDRGAFDEGGEFWTAGGRDASLLVFPAGASRLTLWASAGAVGGRATVALAGTRHEWTLAPGQREVIDLTLPPASRALPLRVSFTGSFRPADVDPASRDRRLLGLRVGITVE